MDARPKILIVDDDEGMRDTLRDILEEEGYMVACASSGKQGLRTISEEFHNLTLIDIRLPDMSGLHLLEQVKRSSPDTACMLITGFASIETSVEALNLGAEAYIVKPLNIEQVKMSIHRALERQSLVIENRRLLESLKESNEKLKEEIRKKEVLQTKLIESEKLSALGKLVAGMRHEINNPLCAIMGRTQLLREAVEKPSPHPRIKDGLDVIEAEGRRIVRILEYLDLFCTPWTVGLRAVDVNRTIERALAWTGNDTPHIEVVKEFERALPRITANEEGLMNLFNNLINNARDAMRNGGTLQISTRLQPDERSIAVVFRDTGEGIPRENLEHVFEPFFTTRDPGKGIGLGLSIAYHIVKEHGGEMMIASEEGNGTAFTITLPVTRESRTYEAQSIHKKGETDEENSGGRR